MQHAPASSDSLGRQCAPDKAKRPLPTKGHLKQGSAGTGREKCGRPSQQESQDCLSAQSCLRAAKQCAAACRHQIPEPVRRAPPHIPHRIRTHSGLLATSHPERMFSGASHQLPAYTRTPSVSSSHAVLCRQVCLAERVRLCTSTQESCTTMKQRSVSDTRGEEGRDCRSCHHRSSQTR